MDEKNLGILLVLILVSGMGFAFTPMDKKVTVNKFGYSYGKNTNSYYVKLSGAKYSKTEEGLNWSYYEGDTQKLKDGSTIRFGLISYYSKDCYTTATGIGLKALLYIKPSKKGGYQSEVIVNMKRGDNIVFIKKDGKQISVKLEYLTVPYITRLLDLTVPAINSFNKEFIQTDLVNILFCDKDNSPVDYPGLPEVLRSTLEYYFYYMNNPSWIASYDTITFFKPKQAYAILKITELN